MHERIRELRKSLGLTGAEFGARIGLTNSTISRIESGQIVVTSQTIRSICREFSVNESWLRDGEGEPFVHPDRKEVLEAYINEHFANRPVEFRRDLLQVLLSFDPERPEWAMLEAIVHHLVSTMPSEAPDTSEETPTDAALTPV